MKKRILAMLMCMVLMIGIMPVSALAVEDDVFSDSTDLGIFWYDYSDFYLSEVREAMNKELDAAGLGYMNYDAKNNQAVQNDQIDTAIAQGAKLIVVNIVEIAEDTAQGIVDKAAAAEIPVIFFNREVADDVINSYENACFVGTRAAEAGGMQGKMAGDYIVNNYEEIDINGDGKISYIMMKGQLGNPDAEMRTRFAVEFCNNVLVEAEKPELKYYDENNEDCFQASDWMKDYAFNHMMTALFTNPMDGEAPVEVVFANNDEAALGCVAALNDAGWNTGEGNSIPVFGIDCIADAMTAMEEGKMTGSVIMPIGGIATTIASLIDNVANGENVFADAYENFNVDDNAAKIRVPYEMILEGEVYETDYDYDYDYDDEWYDDFEGASGECGDNLTWVLDKDGVLTISGEGAMWDYDEEYPTWIEFGYRVENVVIEEGVTHIGSYVFYDHSNLNNIYIPASVSSIGEYALGSGYIYGGVWVDEANEHFSSDENGILFNKDKTELVYIHEGIMGTYIVPVSVTTIKDYAFAGGWGISRLVFEGDAPNFEEYAFDGLSAVIFYPENNDTWTQEIIENYDYLTWCSYDPENPDFTIYGECGDDLTWALDEEGTLTISGEGKMWSYDEEYPTWIAYSGEIANIVIEDGAISIGAYAFEECAVSNVYIPASIERIAPSAFVNCVILDGIQVEEDNEYYCNDEIGVLFEKDLEVLIKSPWGVYDEYVIPEGVVAIEAYAFSGCDFECIVLPESLEVISEGAFSNCWNFTTISIPANVNIIGDYAFNGCWIEEFTVDEENEFYSNDEYGVLFNKDKTELIIAPWTLEGIYVVPEGVEVIAGAAFAMGDSITELQLPSTLTYIAAEAFSNCYNVSEMTLPESVKFVGDWVFSDDLNILTVKGDNTTFSEYAFDNCWNLTRIVFEGNAPKIFGFDFYWPNTFIFYPEGNETWTEEFMDTYYGAFMSYDPENPDFSIKGECGDNLTWVLSEDGTLTISGEGDMWDYDRITWYDFSDMIYSIVVEEGVTSIGGWAFEDLWNVETISIPDTVTSIGQCAISNMDNLLEANIPASVTEIEVGNFDNCENLSGIWVDEDNEYYSSDESGALLNKDMTELLIVPRSFEGEYVVPDGVVYIDYYAFYVCRYITDIMIPASVNEINTDFEYCSGLTGIWVAEDNENYSSDESGALLNEDMTELLIVPRGFDGEYVVPDSVVVIEFSAFDECEYITDVVIPASVEMIESSFQSCYELTGIWVDEDNENYSSDESGALLNKDMTELLIVPRGIYGEYVVPDGVVTIAYWAINGFDRLTSLVIPASVEVIAEHAIVNSDALEEIIVDEDNEYYSSDELGVLYNKDKTELVLVPCGYEGFEYTIPASVTNICDYALDYAPYELTFLGDAPSFDGWLWREHAIYYPEKNPTWTEEVMQNFGDYITWIPYSDHLRGDINSDGRVSNSDLVILARYVLDIYESGSENAVAVEKYGDLNNDGRISNADLVILARINLEMI